MKKEILWKILATSAALAIALFVLKNKKTSNTTPDSNPDSKSEQAVALHPNKKQPSVTAELPNDKPKSNEVGTAKPSETHESTISLTSGNFESFVLKCFQGEHCKLGENPWKIYQDFKLAGNRRANDSLISFLRSRLKHSEFRDQYKDLLKQMIDDFYEGTYHAKKANHRTG